MNKIVEMQLYTFSKPNPRLQTRFTKTPVAEFIILKYVRRKTHHSWKHFNVSDDAIFIGVSKQAGKIPFRVFFLMLRMLRVPNFIVFKFITTKMVYSESSSTL